MELPNKTISKIEIGDRIQAPSIDELRINKFTNYGINRQWHELAQNDQYLVDYLKTFRPEDNTVGALPADFHLFQFNGSGELKEITPNSAVSFTTDMSGFNVIQTTWGGAQKLANFKGNLNSYSSTTFNSTYITDDLTYIPYYVVKVHPMLAGSAIIPSDNVGDDVSNTRTMTNKLTVTVNDSKVVYPITAAVDTISLTKRTISDARWSARLCDSSVVCNEFSFIAKGYSSNSISVMYSICENGEILPLSGVFIKISPLSMFIDPNQGEWSDVSIK